MDIINILLMIAVAVYIIAAIFLLINSRNKAHVAYFFSILGLIAWTAVIIVYRAAPAETSLFWSRMLYITATFTASPFLYFTYTFPKDRTSLLKLLLIAVPQILLVALVLSPNAVIETVTIIPGEEKFISFGPLYFSYASYISGYFLLGLINLAQQYRKSNGIQRQQTKFVFLGYFFASNLAMITNLLLPWLGDFRLNWLGQILSFIMIISTVFAIVKYRLFDIQIQTQKILNAWTPALSAVVVAAGGIWLVQRYTTTDMHFVIPIALLVTIGLNKLFGQLFKRTSLGYFLFRKTHKYQNALRHLAEEAASIINMDELTNKIVKVLVDEMHVEKVAIFIHSGARRGNVELLKQFNFPDDSLNHIAQKGKILTLFGDRDYSYICDEVDYELRQRLFPKRQQELEAVKHICQLSKSTVILPLRAQQSVIGFIALGNKFPDKIYTKEDLELLEDISKEFAIALMNSKLHQDRALTAKMLREEVDRATEKWKQKAKENEELFNVKSQFITVASHQMRTPISVLRNTMQMLLQDYLTAEENEDREALKEKLDAAAGLVRNSYLAGENLRHTSEMILAASEFVGGGAGVNVKDIETKAFFDKRIGYTQDMLQAETKADVHLQTEIAEDVPAAIQQDNEKLGMILDILLSNAVLYTNSGSISLNADVEDTNLVVSVTDTGIGIPDADQNKLFQQFIRLDNAKKVVPDGTGLGLYLAKEYSQLLGGDITFESQAGVGSTFTVTIPIKYQYA
jgi:signal transduction histidine kinase